MADTGMVVGLIKALGGTPDPAVITEAVNDWLDDHPEATTTVEDGSITKAKLDSNLAGAIDDVSELKTEITTNKLLTPTAVEALLGILSKGVYSESVEAKLVILEHELSGSITPSTYLIGYSLDNVSSSNTASSIDDSNSYTTTLTASGSGYEISSVTITMGGVDITSTAYNAATGGVSITNVVGDILIAAVAIKTIYLTPIRTGVPNETTYVYSVSTWYNGLTYENNTISGGEMIVTFDDEIATNFQFKILVLDSSKEPYEHAGYKNPQNLSVEGAWEPYYYAAGTTGTSFATAAKSFHFNIPDGCYAFCFIQFTSGVIYGGQDVTTNNEAVVWALNGGITVGIKGGIEDE